VQKVPRHQPRQTAHWPTKHGAAAAAAGSIGSIYCPAMAAAPAPRDVDAIALDRIVRRLARAGSAPWLHAEVARRMGERLAIVLRSPPAVADWWSRLGAGGEVLRAAYPDSRILAVEPAAWPAPAPRPDGPRRGWWPWRRAEAGPARIGDDAIGDAAVELLWANMMLHLVPDPQALLRRWHRALAVDGFLMFSTLGPGSLAALRALYARQGWRPPHAPFVDMHDLGDMLVEAGFADPVMDQETLTLTWADAAALLGELRALGGNAATGREPGLRTPRWRATLLRGLQTLAGPDGRPRLDLEIVYGHAFKAAPRPRVAPRTEVALTDLRAMVRGSRRGPGARRGLR
jgi:malonyl-CoA O-methyltransferase